MTEVEYSFRHHSGPIPDAEALAAYETVLPGLASRIMTMAEAEGAGRRERAGYHLATERLSLITAATVVLGIAGGAFYTINAGNAAAGVSVIIAELVGMAGVFIYGKRKNEANRTAQESEP